MAGTSLLVLLDDIATVLDDVAVMTKLAVKKTAGVLGDDLALNAEQVSGVRANRELPVVWAVAVGSAKNKLILVPAALLISAFAPVLIVPLLMCGGLYLCYEGAEKILHTLLHRSQVQAEKTELIAVFEDPRADLVAFERNKIKGAIRTDFVLSAEIIVIALGTVSSAPFVKQALVVVLIAAGMTVGVYGLVALIVKLDDIAVHLQRDRRVSAWAGLKRSFGRGLLVLCPWLMKALSVLGTAAMFLVGGGILVHGIPVAHHALERLYFPGAALLANVLMGLAAGAVAVVLMNTWRRLRGTAGAAH